jgi:gliding motility-associated-like protein
MALLPLRNIFTLISVLLAWLCPLPAFSQTDAHWYFGRKAALDFNVSGSQSGPAVLSNSVMTTAEAAAAVSDNSGKLLFYTNGVQVFNRNHRVMLNGDGLKGDASACQIAVVPQPGSNTIFYIFTTDAFENDFLAGYYYSVVDISGDGGLGDVISKNNLLWASCSERITAIRHANGTDVWIITNDLDSKIFRAWLLTCNGFTATNPVVSTIGEVMNQNPLMNVGVMKGSPDGRFLCQTHFPFTDANNGTPNFAQLFDFNNATGVISNPRKIGFPSTHYNHCEFSPDSKQLYLTRKNNKKLDQFDISLPTLTDILNSRQTIPTGNAYYDIQLAMDERIYLTQGTIQLARINFPNERGAACNFQENAVNISPGSVSVGLPSHINDIVGSNNQGNGFSYDILDSCLGRVQFNASTTLTGTISWLWEFGDNTTSTVQNPLHVFANPGDVYTVRLTITAAGSCGKIVRSRIIRPAGTGKPVADFTYNFRCDSNYIRFTNTSLDTDAPGISYLWDFGDGNFSSQSNPVHSFALDGNYMVKLKINTGNPCRNDSVSLPVSFSRFSITSIPDQTINYGQTVQLTTNVPADSYDWSPGKWLTDSTIRNPLALPYDNISYTLIAKSGNCTATDTVNISVIQNDFLYIPTGFTPNSDGKNDRIFPLINGRYILKDFSIFNRNGERVFSTANRGEGWDGRVNGVNQTSGVYVWILQAIHPDGTMINRKGTLTLIR